MSDLERVIETEIFSKIGSTKIQYKIFELLSLFNNNKAVLSQVQKHYESHIENNTKFDARRKETIENLLKKSWLECWLKEPIDMQDKSTINKFFSQYGPIQQQRLNSKIEVDLGEEHILEAKSRPALTVALQEYKKGNIIALKNYVESCETINKTQLERITNAMEDDKFIDNSLSIWNTARKKNKNVNVPYIYLFQPQILKQPTEDVTEYFEIIIANNNAVFKSENIRENIADTIAIKTTMKNELLGTVASLIYDIAYSNVENTFNAIKNIEYILNKYKDYIDNVLVKKANITVPGFEGLLECTKIVEKDYKKYRDYLIDEDCNPVTLDNFSAKIQQVSSVYYKNKLNHKLNDKLENTEIQTLKFKI